ncbi:2-aminomuconate deaminase [Catalinimonas alkaloidigena]|uniref:2-aminomuconate deaminase n=1 Tax=Catalinimonas alkaloidigena TaxID=1075417 RepID=A0A1G8ZM39_9BACT|nr:Rid family hydrolase [Catalinimonas alkaloidigena]SDK16118.1 2-aminomuconate deaminase [Catalinimonas alkaloidigena]
MADSIHSQRAPKPVGAYPHARRVGNLLFLSGVGSRIPGTNEIPGAHYDEHGTLVSSDFEAECHQVFSNVRQILEDAGADWSNLVDVTVFLTHLERDFPTYNRLYADYFRENQPCRTTLGVDRLPTDIAIELKCIAVLD